jgi:hypothetical protein
MAPIHHLCTHIAKQTDDFGPVPQMWAYGSERLNKVLKGANANHHGGGEREETYANAHLRCQGVVIKLCTGSTHGWLSEHNLNALTYQMNAIAQDSSHCLRT